MAIRMLSRPWGDSADYKERENEYVHRATKGKKSVPAACKGMPSPVTESNHLKTKSKKNPQNLKVEKL